MQACEIKGLRMHNHGNKKIKKSSWAMPDPNTAWAMPDPRRAIAKPRLMEFKIQ
jgi:sugar lactone lactonase YvrE